MDPSPIPRPIRFGVFEVDLRTGELRKQGLRIKLQIQPFKILEMLLERPGELVTREEIREKLWPGDTFIDFEHSVNSSIKKLREALGDDAETPRYIETLPRRGYRFIAPLTTPESPPQLRRGAVADSPPSLGGGQGVVELGAVAPVETVAAMSPSPTTSAAGTPPLQPAGAVPEPPLRRRWMIALAAGAIAASLAVIVTLNVASVRDRLLKAVGAVREPPLRIQSLAVLPLENLSRDPDQEYFADGMTDELIATLAKVGSLKVISRTSAMQYKRTKKPLPQIGRELNVDAVVEGTVLRSGNRVRITAQLVHAPTDRHLWAETYESELRDVLVLQGEVARAIADEIKIKLTPKEQARLVRARPVDPEAYEAYLKGRFLLTRLAFFEGDPRAQEVIDSALEYFQLALKKDPNYAPGYVGIGLAWDRRGRGTPLPPREALPKAKAAALKALELDDALADAHEALAEINFFYEWDWAAADREYKRAIELNPNSGEVRAHYSDLLNVMRRPQEAQAQIERALELDPLNPMIQFWFGLHLMFSRQYDAAIAQAHRMLKREPEASLPHNLLMSGFHAKGMLEEDLAERKKTAAMSDDRERLEAMDRGFARGGYHEAMHLSAETLARRSKRSYVSQGWIAVYYTDSGEIDRALEWLEKAYEERDPNMVHIGVAPDWDPLRSDPRFQALLRRMNFPP